MFKDVNYKGVVATIIALTLGTSMIVTITSLALRNKQVSESGGDVLIAIASGLLVALGYYMGSRNGNNFPQNNKPKQ